MRTGGESAHAAGSALDHAAPRGCARRVIDPLRKLVRHSAVYGIGTILPRLLALILVPIYTRQLTMAEYGVLSLLVVAQSAIAIVAQLGLGSALFREVLYEGTREDHVLGTAAIALTVVASGVVAVGLAAAVPLARTALGGAEHAPVLRLAFVASGLSVFQPLAMAHLRIHQRSAAYSALSVAQFAVLGALSVWFVAVRNHGLAGLMWANILAGALFAAVSLGLLLPRMTLTVDWPALRRMLKMGRPNVVVGLAALVLASADRFLLGHFGSKETVAQYALGYNVALGMNLAVQAVQLSWPAQLYLLARREGGTAIMARLTTLYAAGMGLVGLGLVVLAPEIVALLAPSSYAGAARVVPLVVAAYLLYGLRFMTNSALEIRNEVGRAIPIVLCAATLNLALNLWWIPDHGLVGAAWATLVAYAVLLAGQAALNHYLMPIPYQLRRLAIVVVIWTALAWAGTRLPDAPLALALASKAGLLAAYPLLLALGGVIDARERRLVRERLGARWGSARGKRVTR